MKQSGTSRIVYLNGELIPLERAQISVMDRGFLFGDGVYEVIPVFNGHLFRPIPHLQRLQRSLDAIQLPYSVDIDALIKLFDDLLKKNSAQGLNQYIYIQVTRGVIAERVHIFPEEMKPTVFAQCAPFKPQTFEELNAGASAITLEDIRWKWCYVKAITLLPNVLYSEKAKQAGAKEAILIRNGMALEGTSSNLFIAKNGVLITPPLSPSILGGITRDFILEVLQHQKIPYREANISEAELRQADEIWITSSIKEVLPITRLDNQPVGDGKTGPLWHKIIKLYQHYKNNTAELITHS